MNNIVKLSFLSFAVMVLISHNNANANSEPKEMTHHTSSDKMDQFTKNHPNAHNPNATSHTKSHEEGGKHVTFSNKPGASANTDDGSGYDSGSSGSGGWEIE